MLNTGEHKTKNAGSHILVIDIPSIQNSAVLPISSDLASFGHDTVAGDSHRTGRSHSQRRWLNPGRYKLNGWTTVSGPMRDSRLDIDIRAADDADTAVAQLPLDSVLHHRVDLCLLIAGVHGQDVLGSHRLHRQDLTTGLPENAVNISEVVFALLVLVLQPRQGEDKARRPSRSRCWGRPRGSPAARACSRSAPRFQ